MVDTRIFQDVFEYQMPFLFEQILRNQTILTVPQHFLSNTSVSLHFADILLNFLIGRIKFVTLPCFFFTRHRCLADPDKLIAVVMLRLFKLAFGAVTIFPSNDPVLQPHLQTLISACLKYSSEVQKVNVTCILFSGITELFCIAASTISYHWRWH